MKIRSNLIRRRMKRVSTSAGEESRVGVGLTMSFVRQQYWVPRLRQLTKRVIRGCYAYILLFACSFTRAVHFELQPNQTAEELIKHFKRFITRKGLPRKIYWYNGQTFVAAAKWLAGVVKRVLFICFIHSKMSRWIQVTSSFTFPRSQTQLRSIPSTIWFASQKNSRFDLSLTAPTQGAGSFIGVKKLSSA